MIIEHDQIRGDLNEKADVVVIGSGFGGMTVAQDLAAAGYKISAATTCLRASTAEGASARLPAAKFR
jgi:glycerol-3-phosphate dehydrogenase